MTVLTGNQIEGARLLTLRQMLKLELKGMSKSKGPTAYSTLKMMGFKGTREREREFSLSSTRFATN
jgi:hypothetical protein